MKTFSQKTLVKVHSVKPNRKKNSPAENSPPTEYYQLIIDNNIFRPLGWKLPKKEPAYTLLGTINTQNSDYTKAIILERKSNQQYTVKVGDTLGNLHVKEILPKQVTLQTEEKEIVLQCGKLQFLR